jgi:nitroreductase
MPTRSTTKKAPAKPGAKPKATPAKPKATPAKSKATPAKPKAAAKSGAKPKAALARPKAPAKSAAKPKAAPAGSPTRPAASRTGAKPKPATSARKPTSAARASRGKPAPPSKSASRAKPSQPAARKPEVAAPDPLTSVRTLIRVRQAREFTTRKVTKAELDAITEVARWSGSSRNEQPCRFIAIRDQDLIRHVAELGLPQTRGLPTATAAIAIIVPEEPERELSRAFDDGRAAERILIAAHMLGLGGGISRVRKDVRPGIDKTLRLPSNRSVRTIVGLGHPTDDALQPKTRPGQARLPREEVIYEERWPETPRQD